MMKTIRKAMFTAALMLAAASPAHAQPAPASAAAAAMSAGEVKKVDKAAGKVTIKHGPLVNLGMDAMTMVFRVQDPAMLDQVKVGDKIEFVAEQPNGQLTVSRMQKLN
jgi:Cu(I)/Ag(I) efflux system protein CusF